MVPIALPAFSRGLKKRANIDLFALFLLQKMIHGTQNASFGGARDAARGEGGGHGALGHGAAAAGLGLLVFRGVGVLGAAGLTALQPDGAVFRAKGFEAVRRRNDAARVDLLRREEGGELARADDLFGSRLRSGRLCGCFGFLFGLFVGHEAREARF